VWSSSFDTRESSWKYVFEMGTIYWIIRSIKSDLCKVIPLQASWPLGLWYVKAPEFLDIRHMKVVRSSPLRTGRLHPQEYPGTHYRGWVDPKAHGTLWWHGKIPSDWGSIPGPSG
jgi:hypothetical protein